MAIFIGVIGSLIPAILLGSGVINFTIALIIWIVTILFCIYFLKRYGIINNLKSYHIFKKNTTYFTQFLS